jgi:endo-1,4-beta-xylanase
MLTVTDTGGLTSTATTHVTVRDTTPPLLQVSVSPSYLTPPNHKLVQVTANVQASDVCDANPAVQLVSITSNASRNSDGSDVQAVGGGPVAFGTDVRSFLLRAELVHGNEDRIYTITYQATDASGNTTVATAQVGVGKGGSYQLPNRPLKGKSKDKDKDEREHHRDRD